MLWSSADLKKITVDSSQLTFRITIRVSNSLDPDQDLDSVGLDMVPNCLQRVSADDKVIPSKERVKGWQWTIFFESKK